MRTFGPERGATKVALPEEAPVLAKQGEENISHSHRETTTEVLAKSSPKDPQFAPVVRQHDFGMLADFNCRLQCLWRVHGGVWKWNGQRSGGCGFVRLTPFVNNLWPRALSPAGWWQQRCSQNKHACMKHCVVICHGFAFFEGRWRGAMLASARGRHSWPRHRAPRTYRHTCTQSMPFNRKQRRRVGQHTEGHGRNRRTMQASLTAQHCTCDQQTLTTLVMLDGLPILAGHLAQVCPCTWHLHTGNTTRGVG